MQSCGVRGNMEKEENAMNLTDIIIVILVGSVMAGILRKKHRDHKNGVPGCGCGCSGCVNGKKCKENGTEFEN